MAGERWREDEAREKAKIAEQRAWFASLTAEEKTAQLAREARMRDEERARTAARTGVAPKPKTKEWAEMNVGEKLLYSVVLLVVCVAMVAFTAAVFQGAAQGDPCDASCQADVHPPSDSQIEGSAPTLDQDGAAYRAAMTAEAVQTAQAVSR